VIADTTDIRTLRGHCRGEVLTRQDHRWDEVRRVCNLADDQQPAAIAFPRGDFDRAVLTSFARAAGLHVAKCMEETAEDPARTLLLADAGPAVARFTRVAA
jgi:hypothetical protein